MVALVRPDPSTLTSNYMTGWGFPYSQWPQDLKDQYAYNPTQAKQLLAAAGYPNGFNTDIVADNTADLDLLQIVKSYFAAVGINMEIRTMDSASWVAFVGMGHKQDALAARGNGTLGNSTEPTRQFGKYITGSSSDWLQLSDPVFDAFYNTAKAATSIDQVKQALTDANKYMAQNHVAISLLQANNFGLYRPWLNWARSIPWDPRDHPSL